MHAEMLIFPHTCGKIYFSTLHVNSLFPTCASVLLLNQLVPRVPKVLVKSVQSSSLLNKITYVHLF